MFNSGKPEQLNWQNWFCVTKLFNVYLKKIRLIIAVDTKTFYYSVIKTFLGNKTKTAIR